METRRSRLASIFSNSTWAPRVLRRVLDPRTAASVDLEDFQRATGFLTSKGLSRQVGGAAAAHAATADPGAFSITDPHLRRALQNSGTDQGVLDFFERMLQLQADDDAQGVAQSGPIRELLAQYRASPEKVLDRLRPATDRSAFGYNLFGRDADVRGVDMLRQALYAEAEHRIALGTEAHPEQGFLRFLEGAGLPGRDVEDASAYGWGRLLQRRADPRLGDQGDLKSQRVAEAIDTFRRSGEAQRAASGFTERYAKAWETHVDGAEPNLRTANLFVRHGMLGQLNQSLKEGRGWGQAFKDAAGAGVNTVKSFLGDHGKTTADTLFLEYFPRRINEGLAGAGLGLGAADQGSGFDLWKGLILKRVLPVYGAYQGYRYLDYKGHQLTGTGFSDLYGNARDNLSRLRARYTGGHILGMRRELLPGLDMILPDRTLDEEREHQEHGYDPVRKGRFWAIGSRGSFWGQRTDAGLAASRVVAAA